MENSISSNFESTNSIDALKFLWIAEFKDQSYIMQCEEGIEHKFQEVQNKFNELKYFCLYDKEDILYNRFTVDLEKGLIYYNNGCFLQTSELQEKKDIRLIFFRRHKIELSESLKEKSHIILYFIGFQYNDNQGKNRQIIIQIDNNNNWCLGE